MLWPMLAQHSLHPVAILDQMGALQRGDARLQVLNRAVPPLQAANALLSSINPTLQPVIALQATVGGTAVTVHLDMRSM